MHDVSVPHCYTESLDPEMEHVHMLSPRKPGLD